MEPRRALQVYDPVAQLQFKKWTTKDKLEWLESLLGIYWMFRLQDVSSKK